MNNRDDIAYPFNDGSGNYGRVFSGYVDNDPPDEFTRVRDRGNYGWPFCNPSPDTQSGLVDMPFDRDYQMNQNGAVDCAPMDRISRGIQAHSAPLGLTRDVADAQSQHPREHESGFGWERALRARWKLELPDGQRRSLCAGGRHQRHGLRCLDAVGRQPHGDGDALHRGGRRGDGRNARNALVHRDGQAQGQPPR